MIEQSPDLNLWKASGFSMEPFLRRGDELVIDTRADEFKVGDILLYHSKLQKNPVAHRLIRINSGPKRYTLRSDAVPEDQETITFDAIIGRVDYLRRGSRLIRIYGTLFCVIKNSIILRGYPFWVDLRRKIPTIFLKLISKIQRIDIYQLFVRKIIFLETELQPLPEQDFYDIRAFANGRQAGNVYFEARRIKARWRIWISELYVRRRYRSAGVATRLIRDIEFFARERGMHELWVSFKRGNRAAEKFYEKLGFKESEPETLFWHSGEKVWVKALGFKPLLDGAGEPSEVRAILDAVSKAYQRKEFAQDSKLNIHPAFEEPYGIYETDKGTYFPAALIRVFEVLQKLIRPGHRFLDLGSGDGRIVFLAARLGALAKGLELDAELMGIALRAGEMLENAGFLRGVELVCADLFNEDLSAYDVLFYHGGGIVEEARLEEKLASEMRPRSFFVVFWQQRPFEKLRHFESSGDVDVYGCPS